MLTIELTAADVTVYRAQAFIENTDVDIMPYQIDVRDIGKAHVLAAEVPLPVCRTAELLFGPFQAMMCMFAGCP